MKKLLFSLVMVATAFSAMAKGENDTIVTFSIDPQMHCINCENKIKNNLRFEKGITDINAQAPGETVEIKFDKRKTSVDNIIKGFAKLGYTAVAAAPASSSCKSSCNGRGCSSKK